MYLLKKLPTFPKILTDVICMKQIENNFLSNYKLILVQWLLKSGLFEDDV